MNNESQIIRKDAKNCFVESLNDRFACGKIHWNFAAYDLSKPEGSRQTNTVHIYINADEFFGALPKTRMRGTALYVAGKKKERR